MQRKSLVLISSALGAFFIGSAAHGWSFNFNNDDDHYPGPWGYPPAMVMPYGAQPWQAPPASANMPLNPSSQNPQAPAAPPMFYRPPAMSSYDRFRFKHRRQRQMSDHKDAMESLSEMLFGSGGFNREQAIEAARQIQAGAGEALAGNFHPGSVAAAGSRAGTNIWRDREGFQSAAKSLQDAAMGLALALQEKPSAEQGAIFLKSGDRYNRSKPQTTEAVSPAVWGKFNELSAACSSCHTRFRGFRWD